MAGSDPPAEGGMGVHMSTLPDAVPGIPKGGSLPSTAVLPSAAPATGWRRTQLQATARDK